MRSGRGANVRVHLACASVRKLVLLEARQRCRENSPRISGALLLRRQNYGRGGGIGRALGVALPLSAGVGEGVGVGEQPAGQSDGVGVTPGVIVGVALA
jgi:hypothetical protein